MATELILTKSIEELTPALIAFNNEDLIAYASQVLEKYSGRVYSDDQMKEAKEDRAKIRKIIDVLNSERIRIKKIYNAPMDKFTAQMNEVIELLNKGVNGIDEQVKAKEKADKEAKNRALQEYFNEIVGDLAGCITYERIAEAHWLNATVSEKKAKEEIKNRLLDINDAIDVIKGLGSENESELLAFFFRTLNLTKALQENDRLVKEREIALELQRRRAEARVASQPIEQMPPKEIAKAQCLPEAPAVETVQKEFTVILEVTGTPESMKKLLDYIKANNIACKATKKE